MAMEKGGTRNDIDVGHVELGIFTRDHLKVIHAFTGHAETPFRELFERLLTKIEAGAFALAYTAGKAKPAAVAVVERIRGRMSLEVRGE
jgi:hypothetical protein